MNLLKLAYKYQKKFIENPKKRKIFLSSRQIGKSWTLAFIACQVALQKNNSLILMISGGQKSANELIKKCFQFARTIRILSDEWINHTTTAESVTFTNGSRILSLPSGNPTSLRGYTSQCTIIDEAGFIDNFSDVMSAIAPTITRDKEAQLIIATTPSGRNTPFYDLYTKALQDKDWYVQKTDIYQAIKDGLDVDLDSLKSLCNDPQIFDQEYCCSFCDQYSQLIDTSLIDFYNDLPVHNDCSFYAGIDIGRKNDSTSIAIIRKIGEKKFLEDIVQLKNVEYKDQIKTIKELNDKYSFRYVYVDSVGIGNPIAEFLHQDISPSFSGFNWNSSNKSTSYEFLRQQIFDHKLFIKDDFKNLVINDFKNISRQITDSGKVTYTAGRNSQGHSDITSSIVLALQAVKENPSINFEPIPFLINSRL